MIRRGLPCEAVAHVHIRVGVRVDRTLPAGMPDDNGISSDGELFGSPIHMVTKSAMRLVESFAVPLQRVQYSCRHCTADGHSQSVVFAAT